MGAPQYPGFPVVIGGVEYTMPALSAKAAKVLWPRMLALQEGKESDPLGLAAAVAHACLVRNHPELTEEAVAEHVDLDNYEKLLAQSGGKGSFRRWCDQQLAAEGNGRPQPMATDGTGAPSTPASPLPPGGAGETSTS
jgi:hypothetical protein